MKLMIFATMLILVSCYSREPENTKRSGEPLPSFKLLLTDSTTYFDTKDIPNDKPSVLFFFGPHCPYSKAQMEEIIEDIDLLKGINFFIFTTSPFHQLKSFSEHYKLDKYPNFTVGLDYTNYFADYFEAEGVPYIALYGKDKKLNQAFIGKVYSKQIKKVSNQ